MQSAKITKLPFSPNDKLVSYSVLLSLFLFFFQTLFLLLVYRSLPREIPLFYSRPWGQDQLALRWMIWLIPGLSFIFFLVNTILAKKLAEYRILSRMLALTSLAVIILFLITQFKIITS